MRITGFFACVVALATLARQAQAQGVRGVVVGIEDRAPILGAFVTLIDEYSYQRAAALTDSAGRFFLRAHKPGLYKLRAERIGYETVTSAPMQLTSDTVFIRFEVPTMAIPLDSIAVRGADRSCRKRPDASAVYRLWNAIATALRITTWSQEEKSMEFELFRYARNFDQNSQWLFDEERLVLEQTGALSFSSLDPKDVSSGFMRTSATERTLYGPDAVLFLSNEFQDTHCFAFVEDRKANAIGMSFQPIKNVRNIIDIKGALWADARTTELRRLTFEYTNLPRDLASRGGHGEVEFRKLPNGHWIVQSWWIRTPHLVAWLHPRGYRQLLILGQREEGGHVISVDGQAYEHANSATIEGQLVDSVTKQPVTEALVFASGTPHQATTDSLGHYRLTGLAPGKYQLTVNTDFSIDLGLRTRLQEVEVRSGRATRVNLFGATDSTLFRRVCDRQEKDVGTAIIHGTVKDPASGTLLAGLGVEAKWHGISLTRSTVGDRSRRTETERNGRYYLCWMPNDVDVHVKLRPEQRTGGDAIVNLNGGSRLRLDFPPRVNE